MVGTLYNSPSPEAKPFVTIGQHVNMGDTLCLIEAMKMFNEVEADKSGKVAAILVESGTLSTPEQRQARLDAIAAVAAANAALFAAASIGSEIDGGAINGYAIGGDGLARLPDEKFISVQVYADGVLIRTVTELDKVKRISGNRRAKTWEIQVNGTAEVEQITMATTARELNDT